MVVVKTVVEVGIAGAGARLEMWVAKMEVVVCLAAEVGVGVCPVEVTEVGIYEGTA